MKIGKKALLEALKRARSVMKHTCLPILSKVAFKTSGKDHVIITGTDLQSAVSSRIPCEFLSETRGVVSPDAMISILDLLPDDLVTLETSIKMRKLKTEEEPEYFLNLLSQDSKYEFPMDEFDRFPAMDTKEGEFMAEIKASAFIDAIRKISFCTSKEKAAGNPIFANTFIEASPRGLRFIATDEAVYGEVEIDGESLPETEEKAIKAAVATEALSKMIGHLEDFPVIRLSVDSARVCFKQENIKFFLPRLQGDGFPVLEMPIPEGEEKKKYLSIEVDVKEVEKALGRLLLFTDDSINEIVEFRYDGSTGKALRLMTENEVGQGSDEIPNSEMAFTWKHSKEMPLFLSGKRLLKILQAFNCEAVSMLQKDEKSGFLIRGLTADGEPVPGQKYILMPAYKVGKEDGDLIEEDPLDDLDEEELPF